MTDVHSSQVRSYNMSRIKAKDTKPEMLVRKFLFAEGFRYKLHDKELPGKPDLVFEKYKTVVFVNGCFWHGHDGCRYHVIPKTNTDWWLGKINRNIESDNRAIKKLRESGWHVITIWECDLKKNKLTQTLSLLPERIKRNEEK